MESYTIRFFKQAEFLNNIGQLALLTASIALEIEDKTDRERFLQVAYAYNCNIETLLTF